MKYPIDLPNLRDPRLHVAFVIISIHVLGQTVLGFRVSVPQILAAILSCAIIEMAVTFRTTGRISWPASAMLTGSGVALIFRVVGLGADEPWTWRGWHLFAVVAAFSLLTKYLIRLGEQQVFNPSNVGLVLAFLVLGSSRVEPLDFWWSPLTASMGLAYAIILIGGLLITLRMRLFMLAASFWGSFALFLAFVAMTGRCMTATWALDAICGTQYWWVIITSPEVLIFMFFMITDPKTIPVGRGARVGFALAIALVAATLMSTQSTEFGAKVALLSGLVIVTPLRRLFEARPQAIAVDASAGSGRGLPRVLDSRAGKRLYVLLGGAGVCLVLGPIALGSLIATTPDETAFWQPDVSESPGASELALAAVPQMTVGEDVLSLRADVGGLDEQALALALAESLAIEGEAMRTLNPDLLVLADKGLRLVEMRRRLEAAVSEGQGVVPTFTFERLHLRLVFQPGTQARPSLGIDAQGQVEEVTYRDDATELSRSTLAFGSTFQIEKGSEGRWLISAEMPLP